MHPEPVIETNFPGLTLLRRGKVRDIYDLGADRLLLVATDRISAFDMVLRTGIPRKGEVLTRLSTFWMRRLGRVVPNHLVEDDARRFPAACGPHARALAGRAVVVRRAEVIPYECVARGYIAPSVVSEYRRTGVIRFVPVPKGLTLGSRLPEPIFTPARKMAAGHDEDIPFETLVREVGPERACALRDTTLAVYREAAAYALSRGLVLADTKIELGLEGDRIILIDELLTPDSSRYWLREALEPRPGAEPRLESFDKQIVRDWMRERGYDRAEPEGGVTLPPEIVGRTVERYLALYEKLVGSPLPEGEVL